MSPRTVGIAQSVALVVVLTLFFARYHLVLPSDDLLRLQVLRKERLGFAHTLIVVPEWVERYNAAGERERTSLESSYVLRRLRETGMVVDR